MHCGPYQARSTCLTAIAPARPKKHAAGQLGSSAAPGRRCGPRKGCVVVCVVCTMRTLEQAGLAYSRAASTLSSAPWAVPRALAATSLSFLRIARSRASTWWGGWWCTGLRGRGQRVKRGGAAGMERGVVVGVHGAFQSCPAALQPALPTQAGASRAGRAHDCHGISTHCAAQPADAGNEALTTRV